MERKNKFYKDFENYKIENPDWQKYLTDSTFYELSDWYDHKHGLGTEDENSEEARSFAHFVWNQILDIDEEEDPAKTEWEQRRYEIAKDVLPACIELTKETLLTGASLPEALRGKSMQEVCATQAVCYADALIEELKRNKHD